MRNYSFTPLQQSEAEQIASFSLSEEGLFTDISKGSENRYYLLKEEYRGDRYHVIYDDDNLIGYFSLNDRIRKGYGALQLWIRDVLSREEQVDLIEKICVFIEGRYPCVSYVNTIAYSDRPYAKEVYLAAGFEDEGVLNGMGHDMESYEQDGFDVDEKGNKAQISLSICSKKIGVKR